MQSLVAGYRVAGSWVLAPAPMASVGVQNILEGPLKEDHEQTRSALPHVALPQVGKALRGDLSAQHRWSRHISGPLRDAMKLRSTLKAAAAAVAAAAVITAGAFTMPRGNSDSNGAVTTATQGNTSNRVTSSPFAARETLIQPWKASWNGFTL
jgi:hypothetical protein